MAIWPSTIDDDGSSETGTGLDDAFFDQIRGYIDALAPSYGTFVPTDMSGAGLVFATAAGSFLKIGPVPGTGTYLVYFQMQVVFPATTNPAPAWIGGLPAVVRGNNGAAAAQGYGLQALWLLYVNTPTVIPYNAANLSAITNAMLSGQQLVLSGSYMTY